ncbi:MAG: ATP-binding cassette domain-containing protein [Candidatus Aminicenantes bacterium]|nr:ATP-binding cassette domain-containing protein [Candidatus Aminicenantes bacterium]
MNNDYVLVLKDLIKDFDDKRAVDNFSLRQKKGEILGLLGPNGAGKTTTIRMILNIIAPDSGYIEILGRRFSEKMKNRFGYLPEERGLYRKLKVSEVLSFFGELKGMRKHEIKKRGFKLLQKFALDNYLDKKVEELSKGMAQKLQFIITILHSPELLILDEPFAGLDPLNIELVKNIILEKKREGVTIIFSTHLMEYAEKIVDTVVMINKGRKVLDGSLSDIKSTYGTKFIKIKYEGDAGFVSLLDYVRSIEDYGREMEIELEDMAAKDRLLKALVGKLSLSSFQVTEPSLNNIFIRKANEGEQL